MTAEEPSDVFEAGRRQGQEDGAAEPLTEAQQRNVCVLLRQADTETGKPAAPRRKAS